MKKKKLNLPRAPLPKQTGGAHRDRTKEPARKAKHKKFDPTNPDRPEYDQSCDPMAYP